MYLRLLGESLRRGTRRKLLAVTAIALGTLGASALVEVLLASGDRLAADLAAYGANLQIAPARTGDALPVSSLSALRKIFWRNNIVAVAPLAELRVRLVRSPDAFGRPPEPVVAPLVGTWFDRPLDPLDTDMRTGLPKVRPTLRIAGRWPRDSAPDRGIPEAWHEVALGRRLAARLGAVAGSDLTAELGGRTARLGVTGIVESGGGEEEQAFAPLAALAALREPGAPADRFTHAELFAMTTPEARNAKDPRRMTPAEYDAWYCTAYPSS